MAKFTTFVRNELTGTSKFVGTFDDLITAQAYANVEADRSRKFATWELGPRRPLVNQWELPS